MRFLYVPNEEGSFRQDGFRRPLRNLLAGGVLSEVSVFSLQWRIWAGGSPVDERRKLLDRARKFKPDLIWMQHVGKTGLRREDVLALLELSRARLIYHEADPYSRYLHPLPRAARAAASCADTVFTVGTGTFADNFRRAGARDVRFTPSAFEPDRYPRVNQRMPTPQFDVVMIANRNQPRLRGLPNWRDRVKFVEKMQAHFGPRFAIFGRGWSGPSARGPVDFSSQADAIRSGWVSANWDHFANEPRYFSNRLPISLASGSVHATTEHPEYELLLPASTRRFLLTSRTQDQLIAKIDGYLRTSSVEERWLDRRAAQQFAWSHFRQDDHFLKMLRAIDQAQIPEHFEWDLGADGVDQM